MSLEDVVISLKADLTDDGTFETDWTAFLRQYTTGVGRDTAVDRFSPRRATFVLDNTDSRFSPRNTSSPYSPNLVRDKRVQLSAQVTIAAVTNLLKNPSAETNLTEFAGFSGATLDRIQAAARFGKFGVEAERGGGGTYGIQQSTGNSPGVETYTLACYVKGVGASIGESIACTLIASGGAGGDESETFSGLVLTDGWQRIDVTLTISAGDHTNLSALTLRTAAGAGEKFYSDAWQIVKESGASLYCDGDQPACSWSGTEHGSTSSRIGNPTFFLFTGDLREFNASRSAPIPEAEFVASGLTENVLQTIVSAGPFQRDKADVILQRVIDVIEGSIAEKRGQTREVILDGAMRYGGDSYTARNGANVTEQYDTGIDGGGGSADDPESFEALEGDNVLRTGANATEEGWELDVTSLVTNTEHVTAGIFVRAEDGGADGRQLDFVTVAKDGGGADISKEPQTVTLTQNWQYVSLGNKQFDGADAGVTRVLRLETKSTDSSWNAAEEFFWADCTHLCAAEPSGLKDRILEHTLRGTKWTATELEYLDAFERSAGSLLEELAKSVGGWFFEDGEGSFVFEDYSQRDNDVVTIPRLRLTDIPQDGEGYDLKGYSEPAASLAGVVRVGSFGAVTVQKAPSNQFSKIVWAMEPRIQALSANEERTFSAIYTNEGPQGGLIARRARSLAIPLGGWATLGGVQTPFARNYGRGGEVVVKAPGGGQTIFALVLGARIQNRETTERSFITFGGDVSPVMELDMPAQGFKTDAMLSLLVWALVKYNASPATIEVTLTGASLALLLVIVGRGVHSPISFGGVDGGIGLPVWVRHVQGQGNLAIDALFYTESMKLEWAAGGHPKLHLSLEEAT